MGFGEALGDFAMALFNPPEYERRKAMRRAEEARRRERDAQRRDARQGQAAYGNGSRSGNYGSSAYSFKSGKFAGLPSLYRTREDGATEHFYQAGAVDLNDRKHGHVVIKGDRIVYHRRPGESTPVINRQ